MLILTENAGKELVSMLEGKPPETGLRLSVEKGGCAGLSYVMTFTTPQPGDETINDQGALVYVASDSLQYYDGCRLDYSDSLNDAGFKIENPKAARSCGCGTSFEDGQQAEETASPSTFS